MLDQIINRVLTMNCGDDVMWDLSLRVGNDTTSLGLSKYTLTNNGDASCVFYKRVLDITNKQDMQEMLNYVNVLWHRAAATGGDQDA